MILPLDRLLCCSGAVVEWISKLASSMGTRYCRDYAVQPPPCGLPRTPMRLPRITLLLTAACIGSMTTACGQDFETRRSFILFNEDTALVSISDIVAGEPVTITVGVEFGACDELGPTKTSYGRDGGHY